MSQNQLKGDKKELQYRKTGVVGGVRHNNSSDYQQRPLSGGSGTAPSLTSNTPAGRSLKKTNNGQVGQQSKGHSGPVNSSSNPNPATGVRSVENGSHVQSTVSGTSHKPAPAAIPKPVDTSSQKSIQSAPKAPLSQTSSMTSGSTTPATPSKGDAGKGLSLQFGSISPGIMNVVQVPARTSSAPPKMDELQRNQALHTVSRASPANPVPSAQNQRASNLDGSTDKPTRQEPRPIPKVTKDVPVTPVPPPIQAQKPTVLPIQRHYTQPTGPMQFGGPNAPIPSQGLRANTHQMPIQMTFGGPNTQIPTQAQQPVFVPGIPHHLMPNQGIIHQGPSFGFNPQIGHPLPHQPGNLGMNMTPQLNQQAGIFGSARKTVKITHPDTHEELRLDDKNDGSRGSRVNHVANPQSQPILPYTGARPGGFYPNSYSSGSPYIPPQNSVSVTSNSLAPRFNYAGQGSPAMPFANQAVPMHVRPESSNLDIRSASHIRPLTHSVTVSTPASIKPVGPSSGDSDASEKADSKGFPGPAIETGVDRKDLKSRSESSKQVDADRESVINLESLRGVQEQEGQKGDLKASSQGHGQLSKVSTSESTASKCTPAPPVSKVDVLDAVQNLSASVDSPSSGNSASDNGNKDKLSKDQQATNLQSSVKHEGVLAAVQATNVKKSDHEAALLEASQATNLSEMSVECDVEVTENARPSSPGSSKLSPEPNKIKNNKVKKKRKEMFQKAETLGTNPDLYMAYKGPSDYKEVANPVESVVDQNLKEDTGANLENGLVKKKIDEREKPDPENWEDVADGSTPKLESSNNMKRQGFHEDDDGSKVKKYSRDFLLTMSEQYTNLPEGFQITPDIVDGLMRLNVNDPRDHSGPGRGSDRSSGTARHDRRANGPGDGGRWGKQNPHLSTRDPGVDLVYANSMAGVRPGVGSVARPRGQVTLPGTMGHSMSFQGKNNTGGDRWDRGMNFIKGSMPSPQTPQQVMHKAENKYEVGKVSDEEQAKQRRLKAILNKLTPQNFEKLFDQVKEVNIDNVVTLTGVISQIFDKALMEPTFCEMYANFCHHLASELPELSVDDQKITFRRLLLNKCQEEFERGEREEEEVNKDEGEKKQSEQEIEEKRLKVRRRMLGNIRLIGELYKKRMLTERIMHECIKKLLGHYQNADEENIEALCKLMSTIGEMIDHPKAKEHMDAYFDIMRQLSNDMKLSSRVRFMLKDTIDLRRNKWQQRRKVEGPKKIEEVHRAAAQERLGQTSRLSRGPSMNSSTRRGPPMEYAPRGSTLASSAGGYRAVAPQFREFENRTPSVPLLQRSLTDAPIMLGPQGGLARVMSTRGQPSGPTSDISSSHGDARRGGMGGLNGFNDTSDQFPKHMLPTANDHSGNQERNSNATQKISVEKVYPEERLREMSMAAVKEYYSAKDVKEAELCIKDLNAPSYYPTVISMWVTDAFERKDMERNVLTKLLVSLTKPQEGTFSPLQLIQGFESLLANFEDTVTDAPRAPEFLGRMFGTLVLEDVLPLQDVCRLIHQGGEEPGRLLEVGLAADVLGSILETIKSEKGDATLNDIRINSNLRLEDYLPPKPLTSRKLEMFL